MVDKKLCKDCKWFVPYVSKDEACQKSFAKCCSPRILKSENLVIGGKQPTVEYCVAQRSLDFVSCRIWGICGLEGRFYEPRD